MGETLVPITSQLGYSSAKSLRVDIVRYRIEAPFKRHVNFEWTYMAQIPVDRLEG